MTLVIINALAIVQITISIPAGIFIDNIIGISVAEMKRSPHKKHQEHHSRTGDDNSVKILLKTLLKTIS